MLHRPNRIAKNRLSSYEQAVSWCRVQSRPTGTITFQIALAQLGRLGEARSAVKAGLALNPTFTIARYSMSALSDIPGYFAERARAFWKVSPQGRSPRTMTAPRRLAATLAVDVVGYSRLMGQDEAGT